jgi:hypothetical protein
MEMKRHPMKAVTRIARKSYLHLKDTELKNTTLLVLLAMLSCAPTLTAQERKDRLEMSHKAIDALAEPAPPQVPPENGIPAFNTEYWLGSEAEEKEQFALFSKQIQALQQKSVDENAQPAQRGFHAKGHACLEGTLELDESRPPQSRFGVFSDGKPSQKVIVRYSNGVGWKQGDNELDARGMAVKVLEVEGNTYLPDEKNAQDFLMTNSPTPVGRDAVEFMKFAHANAAGRFAGLIFLITHPNTAAPALVRSGSIDSMVTAQYWSGGAFHLGAHQAIKFTSKPCDSALKRETKHDGPDYLRKDLVEAASQGICMDFFVQFQADPIETPIEHASKEWVESISPLVKVGTIKMPAQQPWEQAKCDQLVFSPWHSISAHKPMGHINRARRFVYDASRQFRHGGNGNESKE